MVPGNEGAGCSCADSIHLSVKVTVQLMHVGLVSNHVATLIKALNFCTISKWCALISDSLPDGQEG